MALVVSENPRLIELDPSRTGQFASDVHDFWRPLYSKDAFIDGHTRNRSPDYYLF
ncbi:MAG: hypothetical protein JNJ54_05485 [Myxococcaceae bacterium]|nr:hypothetical protein [Myxococcaceae bacterium]